MQKNRYFPLAIIAAAILSGCNSTPQNSQLADAHSSYNNARSNPQVTNLAAFELKEAGDSLSRADYALSKGQSAATVDQLAYVAKQQVAIAQETAKRKTAELAVSNAGTKRDQIRLEARTAEADEARQQAAMAEEIVDWQAGELEAANAEALRNQANFDARMAEADAVKQRTAIAQGAAAAELADARANTDRDQAIIAQQEMQLRELHAKKTERGLVITLSDVLFSTGKAQLQSGGLRNVQKLSDFLKQYPQHKVLVEGYTDNTGSNALNQELSERRANAVRTALIDMGISHDRVATRGYGEEFPVTSNDTAASRQLNRRVEIILSDDKGSIAQR